MGAESGSQRILDAMHRGVRVEQVQGAVACCRAAGIETGMFIMWGYEGEEIPDIEATISHVKTCGPEVCLTTVSYPIAGTPYHDEVRSRLVTIGAWRESTDREAAIRTRHSRRFYQLADELLKAEIAPEPDALRVRTARAGLLAAAQEVEA